MSTTIPTKEPLTFRSGDTVIWKKSLADYLPSAGWTLKYKVVGNAGTPIDATVTTSDEEYTATITASTNTLVAGSYTLIGWVEKGSGASLERHTIYESTVKVEVNLTTAATATDTRSHARRELDLLEAAIESYSTRPIESLQIAGRAYTRPSLLLLNRLRSKYARIVRDEENKERIARGERARKIVISFPPVS